jgi:hypothetical protein
VKTERPHETDDTSEPNLADWPSSSHVVDIDHAKGFPDQNPDQSIEKAKHLAPQLTKHKTIYGSRGYESDPDERMKKKLLSNVQQKPKYRKRGVRMYRKSTPK